MAGIAASSKTGVICDSWVPIEQNRRQGCLGGRGPAARPPRPLTTSGRARDWRRSAGLGPWAASLCARQPQANRVRRPAATRGERRASERNRYHDALADDQRGEEIHGGPGDVFHPETPSVRRESGKKDPGREKRDAEEQDRRLHIPSERPAGAISNRPRHHCCVNAMFGARPAGGIKARGKMRDAAAADPPTKRAPLASGPFAAGERQRRQVASTHPPPQAGRPPDRRNLRRAAYRNLTTPRRVGQDRQATVASRAASRIARTRPSVRCFCSVRPRRRGRRACPTRPSCARSPGTSSPSQSEARARRR